MFLYKRKREIKPFIEYETFNIHFSALRNCTWWLLNPQEYPFPYEKEKEGM